MDSDSNLRRRVVAGVAGLALGVAAVAACTHQWPPPSGTTTTSSGPTSTSTVTGSTGTTPRTTPDTAPGTVACGTINYASGWPTTRVETFDYGPGKCFLDAWAAGTPARLVTSEQTDGQGGHPLVIYYDVRGAGQLRVVTDPTQASPPGPVLVQDCTAVEPVGVPPHLRALGCSPVPSGLPPFDGTDCGTYFAASGWPTTRAFSPAVFSCLTDAWAAGTPARQVVRDQTDGQGGHIRITAYDVLGTGQLRVTTDDRQALVPGPVTTRRCTSLTVDYGGIHVGGCTAV